MEDKLLVGVDIGGTNIKFAWISTQGDCLVGQ
ncbi:putative NBD/HSP70 family sugar kinase [Cytobacillus horneckiae]|nr:ROK family protein [Cytobacillus horneckiae]